MEIFSKEIAFQTAVCTSFRLQGSVGAWQCSCEAEVNSGEGMVQSTLQMDEPVFVA